MEANPKGPAALEIALMRGHWVTVKAFLKNDAATLNLSENDRRFLSTSMRKETKTEINSTSGYEKQYRPGSPRIALHTSFILRFCLKKYSRPSRYDESIYVKLSTMIVDFAKYWVKTSDSVTTSREVRRRNTLLQPSNPRDTGEVSVTIAEGELRKVSIYVFSSTYRPHMYNRYHSPSSDHFLSLTSAGVSLYAPGMHYSCCYQPVCAQAFNTKYSSRPYTRDSLEACGFGRTIINCPGKGGYGAWPRKDIYDPVRIIRGL
jgi:hypothetical protein